MFVTAGMLREHLSYTAWASDHLARAVEQIPPHQITHGFFLYNPRLVKIHAARL